MSIPVQFAASARADVLRAASQYERDRPGFGELFRSELQRTIAYIAEHPRQYEMLTERFHRAFLRRFPFVVVYHIDDAHVLILGVLPTRADPALLAARLRHGCVPDPHS